MEQATILVVEDEFITGADLQSKLKKMGFNVPIVVDTGQKAIDAAAEINPDLALMDITLKGDMTGIEAAEVVGRRGIPVIFLTAHSDEPTVEKAVKSVPFGYLIKPLDERALKTTIQMALYKNEIDGKVRERDTIIQALINANTEPMFIIDQSTNVLVINNAIASLLTPSQSVGSGLLLEALLTNGLVSPGLVAAIRDHFYDAKPYQFEEEYNGKWISYTITPLLNVQGRVDRCAVHSHDVTVIKRAEQTTKALNLRLEMEKQNLLMFEAMMNSMDDFIIGTDDMGLISFVNDAFVKRFGYTLKEVRNVHISKLQDPTDHFAIDQNAFFVDKKRVWNGTFTAVNKFGLKIKTLLKSSPVIQGEQTLSRVFVLREKLS
ncbi:MAG: response regulator [Methanoregula sp.]|jgi:PAS domain S-box-containing protein|nr:response regulator [Methanoregula sp.]